jgi:hypothetical protein
VYPSFERPSSEQQVSICRVCLDKSTPFSFHGGHAKEECPMQETGEGENLGWGNQWVQLFV